MFRSAALLGFVRALSVRNESWRPLRIFRLPGPGLTSVLLGLAALLPLAAAWAAEAAGVPLALLTRDVAAVADLPPWTGLFSALGTFAWAGAAAVCLLTAAVLRGAGGVVPVPSGWFAGAGALSLVLLGDDAFLVHEHLLPVYLGVPEPATYAAYACLALAWLARGRRALPHTSWRLLLAAGAGFVASLAVDFLSGERVDDLWIFAEDAAKWLGVAAWFAYVTTTASRSLGGLSAAATGRRPAGAPATEPQSASGGPVAG